MNKINLSYWVLFFGLVFASPVLFTSCQSEISIEELDPTSVHLWEANEDWDEVWALYRGRPYTGTVTVPPGYKGFQVDGPSMEIQYRVGRLHGNFKAFMDGQLGIEAIFKSGKPNGEWIEYYENGQPKELKTFKAGELHGKWVIYNENGEIKRERIYKDGEPQGDWLRNFEYLSEEEKADYLLDLEYDVMDIQDKMIPLNNELRMKINKLMAYLEEKDDELGEATQQEIKTLIERLEEAREGMMNWMEEWSATDRDAMVDKDVADYFGREKERIEKVAEDMKSSLMDADKFLSETDID